MGLSAGLTATLLGYSSDFHEELIIMKAKEIADAINISLGQNSGGNNYE